MQIEDHVTAIILQYDILLLQSVMYSDWLMMYAYCIS